jgi:hypothetical protein
LVSPKLDDNVLRFVLDGKALAQLEVLAMVTVGVDHRLRVRTLVDVVLQHSQFVWRWHEVTISFVRNTRLVQDLWVNSLLEVERKLGGLIDVLVEWDQEGVIVPETGW